MHSSDFPKRRTRISKKNHGRVVRFPMPVPVPQPPSRTGWLYRWGPGIVTGASDLDPSAVVTATVAGAAFSFSLLWLVLLCVPFLLSIFSVTARVGVESGRGIMDLVRLSYGRNVALVAVALTTIVSLVVIIADLMAVSDAFSMLLDIPRVYMVTAVSFSVWYILIFRDYRKITRALVWVSLPLCLYVAAAIFSRPNLGQLLAHSFVPRLGWRGQSVDGAVAILGSLLTPYIVLWQTSSRTDREHQPYKFDACAATLISAALFFCIMVASASMLRLPSPFDMSTRQAAEALRPAVGGLGGYVFALGIIGSGMVALPVLVASLCYDITQAMGWRYGLSELPWRAKRFYILISAAMIVATLANFTGLNPVKALYGSMILAGIMTVPLFAFVWKVSNDRRVVKTTNTAGQNFWLGAATIVSGAATAMYLWRMVMH